MNSRPENRWARSLTDVLGWSRPFQSNPSVINDELFDMMRKAQIVLQTKVEEMYSWQCLVRMSTLDGELFLHSAYPTLTADSVFFGPDTYRFARAIKAMLSARDSTAPRVCRAVDIGCGAGPGAVLLAKNYPDAEVFGVDINDAALQLTTINASLANVKVTSRRSDLFNDIEGQFDLIISNPPYLVDASKRRYRHGGGALGSELSVAIVQTSCKRLAPGGTLLLYTGSAIINGQDLFLQEAKNVLDNSPLTWTYEEMDPDVFGEELSTDSYSHADRIAAVVLLATKPNSS